MLKKGLIVLLLLCLYGCHDNYSQISCSLYNQDSIVYLDIKAINDDIDSILVRHTFEIPQRVMCDEEKYNFLLSQLDETYHFEDNILVKEYYEVLDKTYSLSKTIEELNKKRFFCE